MNDDKKDDVSIYTETPATGVNKGIEITPSPAQEKKVEEEASKKLQEETEENKVEQIEKTDTSGEAG